MERGNRRETIVFGDSDREMFVDTFGASEKTGWEVFAWVLMPHHYHTVFRTPAQLDRWNEVVSKHLHQAPQQPPSALGNLFGGRYRSIFVENRDSKD